MQYLPEHGWTSRTEPNVQIWDQNGLQPVMTIFDPEARYDAGKHREFVDWLNGYRRELYQDLRFPYANTEVSKRFADKGIGVIAVSEAVAEVTGTRPVPVYRLLMASQAEQMPGYTKAVASVTPGLKIREHDQYLYNPMLGSIVLQDQAIAEASQSKAADILANALGQAATGSIVDLQVQYDPPAFRYWYGYQWHGGGEYYGQLLQRAQAAKTAALVRQKLHIVTPGQPAARPGMEPYRLEEGYEPEAGTAIAIDLLDEASVAAGGKPIYSLVWSFAKKGRSAAVRGELARQIIAVTDDRLTVNQLEAIVPEREGVNVEAVELVEEALQLSNDKRPSLALREL